MENIYNNIEIDNSENNKKIAIKPVGSSWQETRELSQESASGEKVILNNVDPDKFIDIFVDGNYKQGENPSPENEQPIEVIDGCNRFDVQEFQNQFVAGKILNDDGNEISDSTSQYSKYKIFLKANKSYYIKGAFQRLYYYDSAGNFKKRSQSVDGIDRAYMPVKDEYISFQINNNFWNTNKGSEQLTEGTEEKPYLPHGSIGLKFSGKNFLKLQDGTYTNNGITCVVSDGVITANGTASINTVCNIPINEITLNGTYISSSFNTIANANVQSRLDGDSETYYNLENVNATHTFTKKENIKYTKYVFRVTGGTTLNNFIVKPMLSVDVGDYEPYHEPQLIAVDLAGNSIAKVNDSIKDELSILYRNGKVILTKKVNRYIFTGNENWQSQTDEHIKVQNLYISIDNMKGTTSGGSCCCNIAKFSMLAGQQNDTDINICKPNPMGFNLLLDVSQELFPTINSFKQYLLQQYENGTPVYADYELATPQQIELPSIDPLQLWKGTVNAELISNLATNLNVNYNIVPAMPSLEARSDIKSTGEKYNLFDRNNFSTGLIDPNSGKSWPSDAYHTTDYIKLEKNESYIISCVYGSSNNSIFRDYSVFFDKDKKYVKQQAFNAIKENVYQFIASDDGYLKFSYYVDESRVYDIQMTKSKELKPYISHEIGAINIKQQNKNILNMVDYTFKGDNSKFNLVLKNGKAIIYGSLSKYTTNSITFRITDSFKAGNYAQYINNNDIQTFLTRGKYYLTIRCLSGSISTNAIINFWTRFDNDVSGTATRIGIFKGNVKAEDKIKYSFELQETKPFALFLYVQRTEDTSYDNFTFEVMLEKDEETENFEEHREVNHQMILNKPLRGIKTADSSKANYIDENGNYWITDYVADDGIHRKIGEISFDGTENWDNQKGNSDTNERIFFSLKVKSLKANVANRKAICNYFKESDINVQYPSSDVTAFNFNSDIKYSNFIYFKIEKKLLPTPNLAGWKALLAQLKENGTPLTVQCELAEEELEEFTQEERNTYEQLQNIQLFEGKNYINAIDNIEERFRIDVSKIIDGYYSYISNDGYFIVPELDIKYLVDFNESDIPTMPEANETTVKVAGRDGDIPLSTTYEAIPFNIVCYTEDNLSLAEKVKEEDKVNNLLNSIKNKTMTFAFEKYNKFYNVKYSGELTTINYPKCVKFTIPLKSSESYGKILMQKMMVGNSEEKSNTVKEVGGIITLGGPATNPIVSLNDYSIEYNNSILKGSRVEIDSNRSTITNINSDGVKTNVMKFYNHQFPKIENGKNTLKVLSGFDNDKQVSLKWNDLKL